MADPGCRSSMWLPLCSTIELTDCQLYLFIVLSSYGKNQRRDHDQYDRLNDAQPLKIEDIPLESEPWDNNGKQNRGYRHLRQESGASVSDIMGQPFQQPKDTMSMTSYSGYENYGIEQSQVSYASHPRRVTSPVQNNTPYFDRGVPETSQPGKTFFVP